MLFRLSEPALRRKRAGQQLMRLARIHLQGELRVGDCLLWISSFQIRESQAQREIGRKDFGLGDRIFVSVDRFAGASGFHEDFAELRPDVLQPRVALQPRAQGGNSLVVSPLVGEMKSGLDVGQVRDLIARIGKRPATILWRPDVAERRQFRRLFRIDVLQRCDRRWEGLQLLAHRRCCPPLRGDEIAYLARIAAQVVQLGARSIDVVGALIDQ